MSEAILTLNAGSSSLKFALYAIGGGSLRLLARDTSESVTSEALVQQVMAWAWSHLDGNRLAAVGHRLVHGGPNHEKPERITPQLLDALDRLVPLAPLHLPANLAPIRAIAHARPDLIQVVTFDTAFHRTMPRVATRIAIPRRYEAEGVRRYGFHGLSYEYIAGRLNEVAPALAQGRAIVAHLGNGASLCALDHGESVDTTMGFSALDGLVMGTRPGTIDPGVLFYLEEHHGMTAKAVETLLYKECGLKGVSGISGDMRALLASGDGAAREAIQLFVFRLVREIGALTASLGGLDGLVFTAGIGEHAPEIRARAVEKLAWAGAKLDPAANARNDGRISADDSRVAIHVIPTNEEETIARHTLTLIA